MSVSYGIKSVLMMRWQSIGETSFGTNLDQNDARIAEGIGEKRKRVPCITQICGGETFCLALNDANQLIGWGSAFYGELGPEKATTEECHVICVRPHVLFPSFSLEWERIACGWHHAIAISKGCMYAWGSNAFDQIGRVSNSNSNSQLPNCIISPMRIAFSINVINVSAGFGHSLLLDQHHRLWTWGRNSNGELGLGQSFRDIKSVQSPQLVKATEEEPLHLIATGYAHSAAISLTGQLYTFGWGLYHQLGHGNSQDLHELTRIQAFDGIRDDQAVPIRITSVACGTWHTAVCTSSGDLYTWGWNENGQLGHLGKASKISPCVVSSQDAAIQTLLENVKDVVCGNRHTTALCEGGKVFHWGLQASSDEIDAHVIASGHSNSYILHINKD
uniref:Uncharacterized protein AlNc14C94G5798 n=1 Tax=Albugo laibachii Nc14 TaxID=890382 RepID=F0WGS1_9STRA|nr:hypothetical protein VOLCADRAFT_70529 [Albugo laibachii Nc14]|eukprot:CCA20435.1 hypothetical protein VOLCADRAFT_70529 [Albugo laibachii Nc14]